MQKIRTFLKLSRKLKILLLAAYLLLGYVRIILLMIPFKYIIRLGLKPVQLKQSTNFTIAQLTSRAQTVGKAVALSARYTPWESKCLAQSIVCKIILRQLHIPHTLYIGVAKNQGEFRAHAWIAYNDLVINGGTNSPDVYKVVIQFKETGSGLMAKGGDLKYFAIAGADKKFVWAQARIENNAVVVWSDSVSKPIAVRYAWADNPEGANLYNKEGLPASPFSTE